MTGERAGRRNRTMGVKVEKKVGEFFWCAGTETGDAQVGR